MQLLLVGKMDKAANNPTKKLETYKYRDEVKMIDVLPENEMVGLLSAAYCLLYFSGMQFDLPTLQAMQVGVPIIIADTAEMAETISDTALFADVKSVESIAAQMKIIYKDENMRSKIIALALENIKNNTIENAATQVWSVIMKDKIV